MLGVVGKSCSIRAGVVLLFAVISHGEAVMLGLRMTGTGHGDDPHPGHEQREVAGVDVTHGAQQAVHGFLQHNVARQRHGPVIQQPAGREDEWNQSSVINLCCWYSEGC